MNAISNTIFNRIKMFIQENNRASKKSHIVHRKAKRVEQTQPVTPGSNEKGDLAIIQRKAYMGHFMAGPIALINPNVFK